MLTITLTGDESFNEATNEFIVDEGFTLVLEHSLASVSKWESKFGKPFLGNGQKTPEEILGYVKAMVLTEEVPEEVYFKLSETNIEQINQYISSSMTATWFSKETGPANNEVVTSELIYYWMTELDIPFDCERWHLNRLLTLIRVSNAKRAPKKKMTRQQVMDHNRSLNEKRKAEMGTKG